MNTAIFYILPGKSSRGFLALLLLLNLYAFSGYVRGASVPLRYSGQTECLFGVDVPRVKRAVSYRRALSFADVARPVVSADPYCGIRLFDGRCSQTRFRQRKRIAVSENPAVTWPSKTIPRASEEEAA